MDAMIGRGAECAAITEALATPAVAMLLIEGEPGIGKTTLWQFALSAARERGEVVLQARPGRAERALTYAGLAALLPDAVLDEHLPALPRPRRQALELALLRTSGPPVAPVTLGLAVGSLLHELSSRARVVLAIDDLQWLDGATLRVLEFALRRISHDRILLLGTRRTFARLVERSALESAFEPGRCLRLTVGPLSVGALGVLIRERLGRTLARLQTTRLHHSCGGNPFLALELVRVMPHEDVAVAPGEPFPVSADALTLLGRRVAGLSELAQEALLIAGLAAGPTVELCAQMLGAGTAGALEELTRAGLVRIEGRTVHCGHPLIASAAWSAARPQLRRAIHLRLAESATDVEQRGRHLALGTAVPDEQVAAVLDDAARQAGRRGASDAAAELAELAARLTPASAHSCAAARHLALARYRLDAGHPEEAQSAAARAIELLPAGPRRVDALLMTAAIAGERSDTAAARAAARRALAEAGEDTAARARAHIGLAFWGYEKLSSDLEHAHAALDLLSANETGDPKTAATAMLIAGGQAILAGQGINLELLDRAVELERLVHMPIMERPSTHRAIYLGHAGRYAESIAEVEECLATAQREGDWSVQPHILRVLAWFDFCLGRFASALSRWRQAMRLADELGLEDAAIQLVGGLVTAATGGDGDALAAQALARSRLVRDRRSEVDALKAIGFCALTKADPAAAVTPLREAAEAHHDLGLVEPGWARLHGDWIEALVATGDLTRARAAADEFAEVAGSGGHPWSKVAAARCQGLVAHAEGRSAQATSWLIRALAADPPGQMRFERARTLLVLGRVHRRSGHRRAARVALTEAIELLRAAPSPPWAAFAVAELTAVSGRTVITGLTGAERRVVDLVVAARTNREIATELHISVRTVESHLASAYRKLGVRSRTELAVRHAGSPASTKDSR